MLLAREQDRADGAGVWIGRLSERQLGVKAPVRIWTRPAPPWPPVLAHASQLLPSNHASALLQPAEGRLGTRVSRQHCWRLPPLPVPPPPEVQTARPALPARARMWSWILTSSWQGGLTARQEEPLCRPPLPRRAWPGLLPAAAATPAAPGVSAAAGAGAGTSCCGSPWTARSGCAGLPSCTGASARQ